MNYKKEGGICGLRERIECEPLSEHLTRRDRVKNIGYRLSPGAFVLLGKSEFFNYTSMLLFFVVINPNQ